MKPKELSRVMAAANNHKTEIREAFNSSHNKPVAFGKSPEHCHCGAKCLYDDEECAGAISIVEQDEDGETHVCAAHLSRWQKENWGISNE